MKKIIALSLISFSLSATILDFIYISEYKKAYKENNLYLAKKNLKELSSNEAYFNLANIYYLEKEYDLAIKNLLKIKSADREFKAKVFYNLGNSYAKLGSLSKADESYLKSLLLKFDKDTLYNREVIQSKIEKQKLKKSKRDKKKKLLKSQNRDNENSNSDSSGGKSNMSISQSASSGKSKPLSNFEKDTILNLQNNKRVLSFKQYSEINKGSTSEEKPW